MVAPYEIGDPIYCFLGVPGTGTTKEPKPTVLDLARYSTMASAVAVPSTLPSSSPVTILFNSPLTELKKGKTPESQWKETAASSRGQLQPRANTTSQQQARRSTTGEQTVNPMSRAVKRSRAEATNEKENSESAATVAKVSEDGESLEDRLKTAETKVELLQEQCKVQQKGNQELNERLNQFYKLCRNKEKLALFVRRLNTVSQQ